VPEGDTVHLAARRLDRALADQVLTRTDFRVPRYATANLSGRRVCSVTARGKHLLLRVEGGTTLHTHFAMDGSWRIYRRGRRWGSPSYQARVVLETSALVAVGFLLAAVDLIPTSQEGRLVGHLGPDLLGPDWDAEQALARFVADPDRPVAETLLDQRVMAGIGNVFACEICFLRGVHPERPVGRVAEPAGLVSLAKRLLEANRGLGRQVTTGDLRPGRARWVYGRGGEPCRRCGTSVARRAPATAAERVTYWCPACQPS
jgi:formamidopyrimidine-DNA glycosylase